jgi:MoxR-like ATPase
MQERQVTIDGVTHPLPRPFLVLATQNPIELEGTFPLPEAQVDRFLLRISLGYPSQEDENLLLERFRILDPLATLSPVTSSEELAIMQQVRKEVKIEASIRDYIVRVAMATRANADISLGASPRASLALYQVSQAWAALQGRDYVLPDDVKKMAPNVLCHRLIIAPQAQLRGRNVEELVSDIVGSVAVPVES